MFIAEFENVCGIGKTVDLAMEDLRENFSNVNGGNIDDENEIRVFKGEQVKVTKTWTIEPL